MAGALKHSSPEKESNDLAREADPKLKPLASASADRRHLNEPIVFVRPGVQERVKLGGNGLPADLEQALLNCHEGPDIWVLGGYLRLRQRGYNVELAHDFLPGALCIAHRDDVKRRFPVVWRSFVVAVRADRERIFTCNFEMVQSPTSIEGRRAHYVLHWPQPALRPRDPSRGALVARLGYFGPPKNLGAAYRDSSFLAGLASLGVELVIRDNPADWPNYSDIDVVLAVRDGSPYFLASKPAIKLFNAWLAGCPALVGSEPAFAYHRETELDSIPVTSPQEALMRLRQLQQNPALYMQYVQRARERAESINEDRVVEDWIRFFDQIVMPKYAAWRLQVAPLRHARSLAMLSWNLFRQLVRGNSYSRGFDIQGNRVPETLSAWRQVALKLDRLLTRLERPET